MKFHILSIDSAETADRLKATLSASEPGATIDINVDQKTVTIDSDASEETFRQLITAAGHTIDQ
ncbi:MAG: heavy metal transport/detoxification protein [Cyanobacteria bacterium P01_A01_bin.17]